MGKEAFPSKDRRLPRMIRSQTGKNVEVRTHSGPGLPAEYPRLADYVRSRGAVALSRHPGWLTVLRDGLGHVPYCLEAVQAGQTCGVLPLAYLRSWLFGRFLVSLPYLNSAGVVAEDDQAANALIAEAVRLADALGVKYLEMRHELALPFTAGLRHPSFTDSINGKVHMRLALPKTPGQLWDSFPAKVRNLVRKGQKHNLRVAWGGEELLPDFYTVFSHNMRDLGTPVYGKRLFRCVLRQFPGQTELCVVRAGNRAAAAALLLHGQGVTEVPSASALKEFNKTSANMLLYWQLLERALERGQGVFDFGRSTPDSGTYHFKKQWGAQPQPAEWQYYRRSGAVSDVRPDNPRYRRLIRLWQRLPVSLTRLLGPAIVRGIP
jgi:FemAB-related protein (PEP-CTERM system-associated)